MEESCGVDGIDCVEALTHELIECGCIEPAMLLQRAGADPWHDEGAGGCGMRVMENGH